MSDAEKVQGAIDMREILFRGKRKDNGEWVDGCLINKDGNTFIVQNDSDYWHPVIPETVGQYTGLKDKNGVEIYEGDIVKANMDFGPGGMAEQTTSIYWDENVGGWQFDYFDKSTIEIIGNTNPCPICNEEHPDYSGCCGIEVRENGVNVLSIATREWNHYTDDFDYVYLEVNYCPMCGRDLKGDGK